MSGKNYKTVTSRDLFFLFTIIKAKRQTNRRKLYNLCQTLFKVRTTRSQATLDSVTSLTVGSERSTEKRDVNKAESLNILTD